MRKRAARPASTNCCGIEVPLVAAHFAEGTLSMSADPIALARDLIRCRSVTPAEGGALALIATILGGAGFAVHCLTFQEPGTADVDNLYARIGTAAPNFAFAGHTDVVPP